jgi:hypothetical protein
VIMMDEIGSGYCRFYGKCVIMPNWAHAEVTNIYDEKIETDSCICRDNIWRKLKNVEVCDIVDDLFLVNEYEFFGNLTWIYLKWYTTGSMWYWKSLIDIWNFIPTNWTGFDYSTPFV